MAQTSCYPQCSHIMADGRACGSPALRGKLLCYHHARKRTLVETNRVRRHSVALPPLDSRAAIQMSLDEILAAFAAHKISRREAGTYLFALQIGEINFTRMEQLSPPAPGAPVDPPPDPEPSLTPDDGCPTSAELGDRGDHNCMDAQAPAAPPQLDAPTQVGAQAPAAAPQVLRDHNCVGAQAPAAAPQVPQVPQVLLDEENNPDCLLDPDQRATAATHEYDLERPFPLTAKKLRQRRKSLEEALRGYREAHAFYTAMPQDDPDNKPLVVLAYLEKHIVKVETELRFLNEQSIPDSA